MNIEHWDPSRDGPLTAAALRAKMEARGYKVAPRTYPVGTFLPPHTHDDDKMDAIVSGRFEVTIAGRRWILTAGDVLPVPAGVVHSARVLGTEPAIGLDGVRPV